MTPLFKSCMAGNATLDVARVLSSGNIDQGSQVEWFETALKEAVNYPYLATVNSGSSAMSLAFHMLKLPWGSQALTSPMTCPSTTWAIRANFLTPVWCDINPKSMNMCLQDVRSKLTKETRVLVLTHWGGYPIDMEEVQLIKSHYQTTFNQPLYVVEDCSHAWGARIKSKHVGTFGNYAAFDFGSHCPLTCGDGGAILLPDEHTMERAKKLRWFGMDHSDRSCEVKEWGFKYNMNDINATIGIANLEMSKHLVEQHKRNASVYDHQLKNIPGIKLMERNPNYDSSHWLYTMLVERRGDFMLKMIENKIEARPVYKRNDGYECVSFLKKNLPRLDSFYKSIVCIPVGWWLKAEETSRIISVIRSGW